LRKASEEVIEMRYSTEKSRIRTVELIYLAIAAILLLLMGVVASGQTQTAAMKVAREHVQIQQPLYREYRGVRLGMTAADARAKLGEPVMKSDEQDYYVFSDRLCRAKGRDYFHRLHWWRWRARLQKRGRRGPAAAA
jgi:hypothetical protein